MTLGARPTGDPTGLGERTCCVSQSLKELIEHMEELESQLVAASDPQRYFHSTYLRTTRAVGQAKTTGGFVDPEWVERWDVVFADLYLAAVAQYRLDGTAPGPWQTAFDRVAGAPVQPLTAVLLGMNAHINYDLPQALLAVITPEQFDDAEVLARRELDHRAIDAVLASRVSAEDQELAKWEAPGSRSLLDRLLKPLNTAGTKRFLRESRGKVWRNTHRLNLARTDSAAAYSAKLRELEMLSQARVADLAAPGQVLLRLARRGFGVELS
jgi:hypothetical protein